MPAAGRLVDANTENKMEIVLQEILQDKIYLDTSNEVQIAGESEEPIGGLPDLDPTDL